MKKFYHYLGMALLMSIATLGLVACEDDDKDNNGGNGQTEEKADKAEKFWAIAGQLVGLERVTDDYQDKTFEPTIGVAEGLTRVVQTNDMTTAAQRFANLVDAPVTPETASYTYNDPDVGTLTYTRVNDGNVWATVDVNIKQIPHLQQIVYRASSGENGSFGDAKAYFRFGDIISRQVNKDTLEYWICVRPAFTKEGKGDSHWVCVNYLPVKNQFHHPGSNGQNYYVPTKIGQDKEHMQNLAEMLYAIFCPEQWYHNADSLHRDGTLWGYSGVPIFNDFSKKYLNYHNQYFWLKVQRAWGDLEASGNIISKVFNTSYISLTGLIQGKNNNDGSLHLLYKGYSWYTKLSWNLSLYEAIYKNGSGAKNNMHDASYQTVTNNVQGFGVDCRHMGRMTNNYLPFFNSDKNLRFVVRTATGTELNGGVELHPTAQFGGGLGIKEVYRYYAYYPEEYNKQGGPEITEEVKLPVYPALDGPQIGSILASDGKFYPNVVSANANGNKAVAIVCTLRGSKPVERETAYNGLAMALNLVKGVKFSAESYSNLKDCTLMSANTNWECRLDTVTVITNGIAATANMLNGCNKGHDHPIAKAAHDWKPVLSPEVQSTGNFSEWFVPSICQWILAIQGFGYTWDPKKGWGYEGMDPVQKANEQKHAKEIILNAGLQWTGLYDNGFLYTSTSTSGAIITCGFAVETSQDNVIFHNFVAPTIPAFTIPFIAFKYDGGATEKL